MTKKNFEWFAKFVVDHQLDDRAEAALIMYFETLNRNFDGAKWRKQVEKHQAVLREVLYGN